MQFAEELGFDAVTFLEHDLHSEGFEVGVPPGFPVYVALSLHTKHIQRPYWVRFAWLGSAPLGCHDGVVGSTNVRSSFVGFARGY